MTHLGAFEYYFRPKLDRRSDGFGLNVAVCPPNEFHPVHEHSNPGIVVVLRGQYVEEFEGSANDASMSVTLPANR